jgi:hypothetical protein
MKIAILISGHCRTFVFQEQYIFFEKFLEHLKQFGECDVYLMLKTDDRMRTDQGIINLEKIIKMLNPIYSIAFKQWNQHDDNCYYSQMKMIRHLVEKTNVTYDYYIRIRPDIIIPNLTEIKLKPNLCSSRKFDSRGNDQFFIMNKQLVKEWFLKLPIIPMTVSPEYYIFNIYVEQCINSGLVREYKRVQSWNFYHCHLNTNWLSEQSFVSIPNEIFINKLKNIIHYQEVL